MCVGVASLLAYQLQPHFDPTPVFPWSKKMSSSSLGADFSAIKTHIAAGRGGRQSRSEKLSSPPRRCCLPLTSISKRISDCSAFFMALAEVEHFFCSRDCWRGFVGLPLAVGVCCYAGNVSTYTLDLDSFVPRMLCPGGAKRSIWLEKSDTHRGSITGDSHSSCSNWLSCISISHTRSGRFHTEYI